MLQAALAHCNQHSRFIRSQHLFFLSKRRSSTALAVRPQPLEDRPRVRHKFGPDFLDSVLSRPPSANKNGSFTFLKNEFISEKQPHDVCPNIAELGASAFAAEWAAVERAIAAGQPITKPSDRLAEVCGTTRDALDEVPDTPIATLHRFQFRRGQQNPPTLDMLGPPRQQLPAYSALKTYLSAAVLSSMGNGAKRDFVWAIVKKLRILRLPPDRHVISAVLHMAVMAPPSVRRTLHDGNAETLEWCWKEWSVRRDRDPDIANDNIILAAFLQTSNREAIEGATWPQTLLDLAEMETGMSQQAGSPTTAIQKDSTPLDVDLNIIASVAIAALRMHRFALAVSAFRDPRIAGLLFDRQSAIRANLQNHQSTLDFHTHLSLVQGMALVTKQIDSASVQERKYLAVFCSQAAHNLAQRLQGMPMSLLQHTMLGDIVDVLFRYAFYKQGIGLLKAVTNLSLFQSKTLASFFQTLSYHKFPYAALAIYSKLDKDVITVEQQEALLKSPFSKLSDAVWQDLLIIRPPHVDVRLLNARLIHYANRQGEKLSYKQMLVDHADAINVLGVEPTPDTDNLLFVTLLKGGSLGWAYRLYERVKGLAGREASVLHMLKHMFTHTGRRPAHQRAEGPLRSVNKLAKAVPSLAESKISLDGRLANVLVRNSIHLSETDNATIWAHLEAGLQEADRKDWYRELKPLFKMVIKAFNRRGNSAEAKKVVQRMVQVRVAKIGR